MRTIKFIPQLLALFIGLAMYSQNETNDQKAKSMKTYVIEREIPNAGNLTTEELKGISKKSNEVLAEMGQGIEWQHSYVTDDKVFCVYKAENKELLVEHAKKGGFPINNISELSTVINPTTAKE